MFEASSPSAGWHINDTLKEKKTQKKFTEVE